MRVSPRVILEAVFRAAVEAVNPYRLVRSRLRLESRSIVLLGTGGVETARHDGPVHVVAAGKAALPMSRAVVDLLGPTVSGDGVAPRDGGGTVCDVSIREGGHPVPTAASLSATAAIWDRIPRLGPDHLFLVLLSGGASSLLVRPAGDITLSDKAAAAAALLECGAPIAEMNTVRRHLSTVKGGGLARRAGGRAAWTLILSDVVGNDLAVIGSGPMAPDPSTYADAVGVMRRYRLEERLPARVVRHLLEGVGGGRLETVKPGERCLGAVRNVIVGSNHEAMVAAGREARGLGYEPVLWSETLVGDTTEAANRFVRALRRLRLEVERPTCVLAGGETTVCLRGGGRGGRNQEFGLVAACGLDGLDGVEMLSAGSDGIDGPTDAAGAFVNATTLGRARAHGLDVTKALAEHDSYELLRHLDALFRPGPTGTNVMDLKIALVVPAARP